MAHKRFKDGGEKQLGDVRKELYAYLEVNGLQMTPERHDAIKAAFSEYAALAKRDVTRSLEKTLNECSALKQKYGKKES